MKKIKPVIARKIALDIDKETSLFLDGQSRICNRLWNDLIHKSRDLVKHYIIAKNNTDEEKAKDIAHILYNTNGLRNLVPAIKEANPFFYQVYSSALKNTARRVEKAIKAYQKQKVSNPKIRWPKFRAFKKRSSALIWIEFFVS